METQVRFLAYDVQLLQQAYHFLHLNQGNILKGKIVPTSTFLKAMATSIDENRQNPFDNIVTESDVEEGAPDIAIVDSDADNDLGIEI